MNPPRVPCEGSECPPCAVLSPSFGLCGMCGKEMLVVAGEVVGHSRVDVLKMLAEEINNG